MLLKWPKQTRNHTAYTPGPWTAERNRLDGHEWFIKSERRESPPFCWCPRLNIKLDALRPLKGRYVDARSGHGASASDEGCCPTAIAENKANAMLISAAPDLLEALQIIKETKTWPSKADAAIAKATGADSLSFPTVQV